MALTTSSVRDHLRALGYSDSAASDSFLRECAEELNGEIGLRERLDNVSFAFNQSDLWHFDDLTVEHEDSISAFVASLSNRVRPSPALMDPTETRQKSAIIPKTSKASVMTAEDWRFTGDSISIDDWQHMVDETSSVSSFQGSPSDSLRQIQEKASSDSSPLCIIQHLAAMDISKTRSRIPKKYEQVSAVPSKAYGRTFSTKNSQEEPPKIRKASESRTFSPVRDCSSPGSIESIDGLSDKILSPASELSESTRKSFPKTTGCNDNLTITCVFSHCALVIKTIQYRKTSNKTDPVARFHSHQKHWQKDEFLTRISSKPKPILEKGHFAAEKVASTGNIGSVPRTRHNLAALRPTYVVPNEKSRRDVVWEVRTRLARTV
ncbi:hypothetical protein HDU84_008051 [Entophlyctis sp. JEL0112]|nr:hypothetical protein HDU84_008051 [Entophlyctis sp. JEL0112]